MDRTLSGLARLRLTFDRGFAYAHQRPTHGIHAENLGQMARSMGLDVLFEQSEPVAKTIEVQGITAAVSHFAERVMSLVIDEAVPDRLGWNNLARVDGAQFDVISPLIRGRVQHEIDLRILTPLRERNDFSWMGFYDYTQRRRVNNWNPWINSNWLITALLMEHDAERRLDAVAKSIRSLDAFLDPYPRDGGCDEGPSYWTRAGASLLDCLELLLSTTGGAINVYDDPLIREIGRFIYRVHIADDNFVNFADAPARFALPAPQVFLYGQRIGDDRMMQFGAYAAAQQDIAHNGVSASLGRRLYALSNLDALLATKPVAPYPRDAWLPDIEVMTARDRAGSPAGYFVAAKGGHNAESHNHNDVGTFVVYKDGKPLIIDAGVETYTAKTFSPQRYEIWTMQSAYHNLPTIVRNDITVMQADGEQFAARNARHTADDAAATLEVDIAPAYPVEAGLTTWQRTVTLWRGESVIVTDAYELTAAPNALTLNLMTCCAVDLVAPGRIVLHPQGLPDGVESAAGEIAYPAETFAPSVEEIALTDTRLRSVWGEHLWRIVLTTKAPPARGTWTVSVT